MLLKRRGVHHLGGTGLAQNWKKGKTLALMPLIKTIYRREQKKKSLFLSFFFRWHAMARLSSCKGSWPDMDDIKKVKWLVSGQTKKKKNSKKRQMTRKWACGGVSYEQVGSFAYTRQERILEKERRNGKESSSHSIISVVSWTAKSSSPVISSRFLRLSFLYFLFGSADDASTIVLFLLGASLFLITSSSIVGPRALCGLTRYSVWFYFYYFIWVPQCILSHQQLSFLS